MAAVKHEVSIHIRLSDEADAMIELLAEARLRSGIPAIDVFDANYGTVKAYHADVWREAFAIEIEVMKEVA